MSGLGPVHEDVLGIIEREPGLKPKAIYAKAGLCKDETQCSKVLHGLLTEKLIKKSDENAYYAAGAEIPAPAPQPSHTQEGDAMTVKLGKKQQAIYDALPANPAVSVDIDRLVEATGFTVQQIQAQISILKKKGLIKSVRVKPEGGGQPRAAYSRGDGQPADTPPPKSPAARKPAAAKPAGNGDDPVEQLLEKSAREAQDALDEYIASVVDTDTLRYFREQRDAARRHLEDYRARRSA